MRTFRWILLGAFLAAAANGSGCRSQTPSRSAAPPHTGRLRIAVIPKGTTHEFWKSVHYGAQQAAEELDVDAIWMGPQSEGDREGQITVVQNFVTQGVDAICLAPLDSQALVGAVREASNASIPTVILDSGLADEKLIVSYVATDNAHGGALAAEEMARRLNGRGRVILLRYAPGSESTEQREAGFLQKIAAYPDIEVISSSEYAGTDANSALDKAQQLLVKYRDQFEGIFAVNESSASGVLQALENAELTGRVVFIGFDPSERMVQALAQKKLQAMVLQDPVRMGYLAVKTAVDHLRGETVPRRVVTGEYLATSENMDEPRMKELLHPAQYAQ